MSSAQVVLLMSDQRRRPAVPPNGGDRSRVRRNLFGPIDREQTERLLQREFQRMSREDNRKWNFDFSKEKPLRGRYEWSAVEERDQVHDSYQLKGLPFCAQHGRSEPTKESQPTSQGPPENPQEPQDVPSTDIAPSTSRQSTITDFMRQRKRLLSTKTSSEMPEENKKPKPSKTS